MKFRLNVENGHLRLAPTPGERTLSDRLAEISRMNADQLRHLLAKTTLGNTIRLVARHRLDRLEREALNRLKTAGGS